MEHTNETVDAIIRELEREFDDESRMRSPTMAALWTCALVIGGAVTAVVAVVMTGIWPGFQLGSPGAWR